VLFWGRFYSAPYPSQSKESSEWLSEMHCISWYVHQCYASTDIVIFFVFSFLFFFRAEPVLSRIKENRKRVISPSFDNIKYDNFEIEEYPLSAQGFDWELWCRYLNPPKSWWKLENTTAPIR